MRLASRLPRSVLLLAMLAAGSAEVRAVGAAAQPPIHPRTARCSPLEQDPLPGGAGEGKRQKRTEERASGPGVVRGQVLAEADAMGEAAPIGGAQVVLFARHDRRRDEELARAISAEDGSFVCESDRLGGLLPGRVRRHTKRIFVRASADGCLPSEKRCALSTGEWSARVELAPGIMVQGLVVDPSGKPMVRAIVEIDRLRSSEAAADSDVQTTSWEANHGRTDDEGRFALGVLGAGHYALIAEKNGVGQVRVEFVVPEDASSFTVPGVVLVSQASLAGVLTTSGGVPLPGVQIRAELVSENAAEATRDPALAPAGLVSAHASTDQQGHFEIGGLLPGSYSLVAKCSFGSRRRPGAVPGREFHMMTDLAEAPLAASGDAPGSAYAADGGELVLILDACLLAIEVEVKQDARAKVLWVAVVESTISIEAIFPEDVSLVKLRSEERRATIRSTPGVEARVVVARGGRSAGRKLQTLATQRVPVSPTAGVQQVKVTLH